jgi:hypothetical protein
MREPPKFRKEVGRKPRVPKGPTAPKVIASGDDRPVREYEIARHPTVIRLRVDCPEQAPGVAWEVAHQVGVEWAAVVGETLEAKPGGVEVITPNDWAVIAAVKADTEDQLRERLMEIAKTKHVVDYPGNEISQAWGRNGFP